MCEAWCIHTTRDWVFFSFLFFGLQQPWTLNYVGRISRRFGGWACTEASYRLTNQQETSRLSTQSAKKARWKLSVGNYVPPGTKTKTVPQPPRVRPFFCAFSVAAAPSITEMFWSLFTYSGPALQTEVLCNLVLFHTKTNLLFRILVYSIHHGLYAHILNSSTLHAP